MRTFGYTPLTGASAALMAVEQSTFGTHEAILVFKILLSVADANEFAIVQPDCWQTGIESVDFVGPASGNPIIGVACCAYAEEQISSVTKNTKNDFIDSSIRREFVRRQPERADAFAR